MVALAGGYFSHIPPIKKGNIMIPELLPCPLCNALQDKRSTRTKFKCRVCREWLELDPTMSFFQSFDARQRADKERKAQWLEREVQKVLYRYGSWEEAQAAVRLDKGMNPAPPARGTKYFPVEA
jgi:hypothetical protein